MNPEEWVGLIPNYSKPDRGFPGSVPLCRLLGLFLSFVRLIFWVREVFTGLLIAVMTLSHQVTPCRLCLKRGNSHLPLSHSFTLLKWNLTLVGIQIDVSLGYFSLCDRSRECGCVFHRLWHQLAVPPWASHLTALDLFLSSLKCQEVHRLTSQDLSSHEIPMFPISYISL